MEVWEAFDGRPHGVRMGLRPLDPRAWTDPPPPGLLCAALEGKERLLAGRRGAVLAEPPGCEAAAAEMLDHLVAHLVADHATRYRRGPGGAVLIDQTQLVDPGAWSPLEAAARLTAGDWCLIRPGPPPVLAAGVVCSPNRWRLADKIGRPLRAVHESVPGYAATLAAPVDRVLAAPERGRPVWRQNWSLLGDPELFQPEARSADPADVPGGVWVRSERQTLLPLIRTGWWVFGIETGQLPLGALAGRPELARRVLAAVTGLDPATSAYKGLDGWRVPLTAWLEATAGPVASPSADPAQQHE